ncbi:hypothetical protein ACLJJ6_01315 [Pediococcus siamensis]|uniref:hypothetical protein n=1 Tax=Pediococcus siamensis TaxID=381829 RepID=UPI0039A0F56E
MKAFKYEIQLLVKNLTFLAFVLVVFAFYYTQYQSYVNVQITNARENEPYTSLNYFMKPTSQAKDFGQSFRLGRPR